MSLTPADIRNKQFATTRLRPGYDEEEVDAFLDEIEAELERLLHENQELRAELSRRDEAARRGEGARRDEGALAVPGYGPRQADPAPAMLAPQPLLPQPQRLPGPGRPPEPQPVPEPAMRGVPAGQPDMSTVSRVLVLAQQTADQAIADARQEAGETLDRARREADEILGKARSQAEQLTADARARAESLQREAQERYQQAVGALVPAREELERRIDDLRMFEREYRGRLAAYLEGQLRDLMADTADGEPVPRPRLAVDSHVSEGLQAPAG